MFSISHSLFCFSSHSFSAFSAIIFLFPNCFHGLPCFSVQVWCFGHLYFKPSSYGFQGRLVKRCFLCKALIGMVLEREVKLASEFTLVTGIQVVFFVVVILGFFCPCKKDFLWWNISTILQLSQALILASKYLPT